MCLYPCKSQCAQIDGGQSSLDCPNPNLVPFYGKTAHVEPHHHALHLFTWFFLQSYFFITTTPHHTKLCHLVEWVICCEDFVVKSGVHAAGDRACGRNLQLSSSSAIWTSDQRLHLSSIIKNCKVGPTCSIHILNPFFWLSQLPLTKQAKPAPSF